MALQFVLGLSEILLGGVLEVTRGRRLSCPFGVLGPYVEQACHRHSGNGAEGIKTDVSEAGA